jgi:phosphatidylserine/phosphatidylglycerophosphate/cardiolipin synthase-like enzyme
LFDCPTLHAKIIHFSDAVAVGSANMSSRSEKMLTECVCLTDSATAVSQGRAFLFQLKRQSRPLDRRAINELAEIPVVPGIPSFVGSPRPKIILHDRSWILGVHELDEHAFKDEEPRRREAFRRAKKLRAQGQSTVNDIRYPRSVRFAAQVGEGDSIFEIWRPRYRKQPVAVYRSDLTYGN